MAEAAKVAIISKQLVQPSPRTTGGGESMRRIHLTPWDLMLLPIQYIQKGILFNKPPTPDLISRLLNSFSQALDHFYPLAGRLVTTTHDDECSISLDCTDDGAEFVSASAPDVKVSDILAPYYVPTLVHSFFPLNGLFGYDGHDQPVLGAQVTELADGVFIACSLNHTVADGTSFWQFFHAWSTICRTGESPAFDNPPVFDRWFPDSSCSVPIRLPFVDHREFFARVEFPPVRECALEFSSVNIRKLKEKANEEMGFSGKISSLQAVLAHLWRSICRARHLKPEEETTCLVLVGYRTRLSPPLPDAYIGNSIDAAQTTASAGEVESKGLGWTAWQLNRSIAARGDPAAVPAWFESWSKSPSFLSIGRVRPNIVGTSSSPRFDVYGNDFGWGKPVAVRSGPGNKQDGKMTVFPGAEEGGMTFELCLSAEALSHLLQDEEFMEMAA